MSDTPRRHNRIGLFGPFVAVLALFAAWSGYWFYIKDQVTKRIDAQFTVWQGAGYNVHRDPYNVRGYPFRMFAEFRNITVVAPDGHGLSAPLFQAEANAYALDKWVMTAPQGVTLYRGASKGVQLGTVTVTGSSLRASVSGLTRPIYTIAFVGTGVHAVPSDPSHPFLFTDADDVETYLRPSKDAANSADMLLRLSGAHGAPGSIVGDLSADQPLSLQLEGTASDASAFKGADFSTSLRSWAMAGGLLTDVKSQLTSGDLNVQVTSDGLSFDASKHLSGKVNVEMTGPFRPIAVLNALRLIPKDRMNEATPLLNLALQTQGKQKLPIDFHDGGAWLGPLKVSDAPILP